VAPSNLAVAGRYVFSHRVFRCLEQIAPSGDGEIQLTDAMRLLCDNPGEMCAASLLPGERRFDIGNFDSYFEAFNALAATSHLTN
jgi:UTP--glucose-1-phosphate uridylyltransferase